MKNKLYLVDVSSMFFRAFFAIRELKNSEGLPTNALYGFLSMTIKLLKDFQPTHMVYCRDRKEPSFRKELDLRYKANRSDMPEDLVLQMPYIEKLINILGIPQIDKLGYEADDVIGSLAHWGVKSGFEVVIVSGDKDFAQLVTENITMFDPVKGKTLDAAAVQDKWGVTPEQFIDYLAIVGDSSDNIQGVKGLGPKGAERLLNDFKSLDGIYKNLDKIKGAAYKKLLENKDEAYLCQKLVRIVTDLELLKEPDEATLKEIDQIDLESFLKELEFESFLKNFKKSNAVEGEEFEETDEAPIIEIKKAKDLKDFFQENEEVFYMDSHRGEILVSSKGKYCVLPYKVEDLLAIGKMIKNLNLKFLGFGLKSFFRKLGVSDLNIIDDIKLMCYSLISNNWDFKKAYSHFCKEELSDLLTTEALHKAQIKLYKKVSTDLSKGMLKIYKEMDIPLMKILLDMEFKGVLLDQEMLLSHSEELKIRISKIIEEVNIMVEKPFNLASPKQLAKVLFEDLGLTPLKKIKTGFSTNTDILEKLKTQHPICGKIIEFRELSKLKSTYIDAIPKLVNTKTKRIHTTYKQALTTTGRLSSVNPNLQNIPIRTEEGRRIRKAFVAKPGCVLVSADYSQIELRILAHITKDKGLMEAFLNDQDVHARTAAEVFGVAVDEVTTEQRRMAKAVNFGIAYGQGAYGLAEALGISRKEGKKIIESYFLKFPGVKTYIKETIETAKENFFTVTLLGRKRELNELKSSNKMLQKFGERAAINAPIQGTASDIIKLAMIEVVKKVKSPLLLQVHDELVFEVKEEDLKLEKALIKKTMEKVYRLDVPLTAGINSGYNWNDAH